METNSSRIHAVTALVLAMTIGIHGEPASAGTGAVRSDSINVQVVPPVPPGRRYHDHRAAMAEEDMGPDYLVGRRDRFRRVQNAGLGLMFGGIGVAACGITMMYLGISRGQSPAPPLVHPESDFDVADLVFMGYLVAVAGVPPITGGAILNRIGNHRRARYQKLLDDRYGEKGGRVSLGLGLNSLRLSYGF